ncbi:ABC transporter substrate-binding protein, partial [Oceanithermus sp.]|uniref:ABC transporter substrate-binding protein n=1 Tax=Oceanithermus sp. TaxID=2268145 RepID=UPI002579FB6A
SIERLLVTNPGDSAGWFYAESLIGYDGVNAKDYFGDNPSQADLDKYWEAIDNSVQCVDDYTVQFHLIKKDPSFFVKLMYTASSILDSKYAIENGEWSGTKKDWYDWAGKDLRDGFLHTHDAGTGAYKLVKWDGKDVIAESFSEYWGSKPQIHTIIIKVVDEQATRIQALKAGDADRITVNDRATLETQIRGMANAKVLESDKWLGAAVAAVFFNQKIAAQDNPMIGSGQLDGNGIPADFFKDVNVRKAFAYSFDQDAIVNDVYLGKAVPLTMALPPSFLGYDPNIPIYNLDMDKAEEYFKKAYDGKLWDTGFTMTIAYNSGNTTRQTVAEILKQNIEALNPKFKINVKAMPWPQFLAAYKNGQLPALVLGWGADYADPDNFIYVFYHSNGYFAKKVGYANPEMDKLIEEARSISDFGKRTTYYSRVAWLAYDDVPVLPLPRPIGWMVLAKNVYTKGAPAGMDVYNNPMRSGSFLWKDIIKK